MKYILERTVLGFCWWDLLALIVLAAVIIVYVKKIKKMKETEKELNERLAGMDAEEAEAAAETKI